MALAYIGLGANLGDRQAFLAHALDGLRHLLESAVQHVSTVREYSPVGGPPQGPYLNAVAELTTTLTPHDLLRHLQRLETQLGRVRATEVHWGPRTIDLDLLLYDDLILNDPRLIIPHPRLHERRFVLEPLAEIAPGAYHPILKQSIQALLAALR